jgi:hypothetical protein
MARRDVSCVSSLSHSCISMVAPFCRLDLLSPGSPLPSQAHSRTGLAPAAPDLVQPGAPTSPRSLACPGPSVSLIGDFYPGPPLPVLDLVCLGVAMSLRSSSHPGPAVRSPAFSFDQASVAGLDAWCKTYYAEHGKDDTCRCLCQTR